MPHPFGGSATRRTALQSPSGAAVCLPERFRAGCAFGGPFSGHSSDRPCDGSADFTPRARPGPQRSCRQIGATPVPPARVGVTALVQRLANPPPGPEHRVLLYREVTACVRSCPPSLLLLALPLSAPVHAQDKASAAKDLHALFDAEWERGLRENPVGATYIGDHRFDDQWPDLSPAALKASYEGDKAVIAALDKIDPQQLTAEDQLNRDLFRRQYQANIDTYDYGSQYTPLSQRGGLASMHRIADVVVFKTVKDYEQWLTPHRHDRQARRPEHRIDARRREARPGAAEDHPAARAAAARQADRHGPDAEPVLRVRSRRCRTRSRPPSRRACRLPRVMRSRRRSCLRTRS